MVVIGIKVDTRKSWAGEVVASSDDNLADAGLKIVNAHLVSNGFFIVNLGEFREIISYGTIDSGRILTGRNSNFGATRRNRDGFALGEIRDEFGEKFGWDGNYAILGTRNGEKINDSHV